MDMLTRAASQPGLLLGLQSQLVQGLVQAQRGWAGMMVPVTPQASSDAKAGHALHMTVPAGGPSRSARPALCRCKCTTLCVLAPTGQTATITAPATAHRPGLHPT